MHPSGLYVATTGDCRTVLGTLRNANEFGAVALSEDQTGDTPSEVERLHREHPHETVIKEGRVLRGLQPTRAFGDSRYKWAKERQEALRLRIPHNLRTPPYVTARPEVVHHALQAEDQFVILASDGLWDVVDNDKAVEIVAIAVGSLRSGSPSSLPADTKNTPNVVKAASALVIKALQAYADDATNGDIAALLALSSARQHRDDITATVVLLQQPAKYTKAEPQDAIATPPREDLLSVYRVATKGVDKDKKDFSNGA